MTAGAAPRRFGRIAGGRELAVGDVAEVGHLRLTRAEIMDFARQFDPQPFHLDEAAAQASIFGGLCASGFHSISAAFGLQVRAGLMEACNLGGRGVEKLVWRRPVRPDTDYALRLEVRRIEPEEAKGRATVAMGYVLRDPEDTVVMDATLLHILRW